MECDACGFDPDVREQPDPVLPTDKCADCGRELKILAEDEEPDSTGTVALVRHIEPCCCAQPDRCYVLSGSVVSARRWLVGAFAKREDAAKRKDALVAELSRLVRQAENPRIPTMVVVSGVADVGLLSALREEFGAHQAPAAFFRTLDYQIEEVPLCRG